MRHILSHSALRRFTMIPAGAPSPWESAPNIRAWLMAALALASALALAGLIAVAPAQASPDHGGQRDDGLIRLDQVDGGALMLFTDKPGLYVQAPLVKSDYDVAIAGPLARTVVTQRFTNPATVFVEGKYVFPLPEDSAVDTLRMRVGGRLIEGEIKEREEAKVIYETARAEGFVASLVEQERPNMFTTSVANIGPGESVVIQIEYQQTLAPRDGVFGLRLPLVVAPRFTPDPQPTLVKFGPEGWFVEQSDPTPDRERVTPPVVDPRSEPAGSLRNPVDIRIDLQAGFPLGPVQSLYHRVAVSPAGTTGARIQLEGPAPADRDFFLSWRPEKIETPYLALFTEAPATDPSGAGETATDRNYLMMLTPPAPESIGADRQPREVIFVQDISGSMGGESIVQAKAGLEMAVRRLRPEDRFNIIVFNDRFGQFADAPMQATAENVTQAIEAIRALEADGGTRMLPALEAALTDPGPDPGDEERVRQVIFLTDGAVSNETEMLALIGEKLGRTRLFTVGIGSAPNSYFMTAAAERGRGAHVFIGDLGEVQARMEALFARIETPAMTGLSLDVTGFQNPEVWPQPLPDLYAGDPVTAVIRVDDAATTRAIPELTLRGVRAGAPWERRVRLAEAEERVGVAKLWARQKIRSLEALRLSSGVDAASLDVIDGEILSAALTHGLVSRLTSLVAVDVTPTRPQGEPVVEKEVPLNLPAGWDPDIFFDGAEQSAPPAEQDADAGDAAGGDAPVIEAALTRLEAAAEARQLAQAQLGAGAPLPFTSEGWILRVLAGLALLLLGGIWLRANRRGAFGAPW
ncbi:MAG: marine proteobacterial sortase target protein [Pseudomonadota bacterium]